MNLSNDEYADFRPISGEFRYVDFDDEFDCWAIFGDESGYCYGQYGTRAEADDALEIMSP